MIYDIVWGFIILIYIFVAVNLYLYLRGFSDKFGRDWKKKYPYKLHIVVFNIKFYGAVLIVLSALVML